MPLRLLTCIQCGRAFPENDPDAHLVYEDTEVNLCFCSSECTHEYSLEVLRLATEELRQKKQRGLSSEDRETILELHRRLGDLLKGKNEFPESDRERSR